MAKEIEEQYFITNPNATKVRDIWGRHAYAEIRQAYIDLKEAPAPYRFEKQGDAITLTIQKNGTAFTHTYRGDDAVLVGKLADANEISEIRFRTKGKQGELTIKGALAQGGSERDEVNAKIEPKAATEAMDHLCHPSQIHKRRYEVPSDKDDSVWTVDYFDDFTLYGQPKILVECEYKNHDDRQTAQLPSWLEAGQPIRVTDIDDLKKGLVYGPRELSEYPEVARRCAANYLQRIQKNFPTAFLDNTRFVVVGHVTAENNCLLRELKKKGKVTLVPKSTIEKPQDLRELQSIDGITYADKKNLRNGLGQYAREWNAHNPESPQLFKEMLRDPEMATMFLNEYTEPGENIMILDVGGYFAKSLPDIEQAAKGTHPHGLKLKDRNIVAVTEVTANGQEKYNLVAEHTDIPILSFAKTKTKHPENEIVGPSCVRGTVQALEANPELSALADPTKGRQGVLAVGQVGSQIARHLKKEHGVKADIYDVDAKAMAPLAKEGHHTVSHDSLLTESDVLYVASAKPILAINDLKKMKDGIVLSFATSMDDVLQDYRDLAKYPYKRVFDKEGPDRIEICRTYEIEGKKVHFVCNGRSPNFYLDRPIDPTVMLSLGLVFPSLEQLLDDTVPNDKGVLNRLTKEKQEQILEAWGEHYTHAHSQVDFTAYTPEPAKGRAVKRAERAIDNLEGLELV